MTRNSKLDSTPSLSSLKCLSSRPGFKPSTKVDRRAEGSPCPEELKKKMQETRQQETKRDRSEKPALKTKN